MTARRLLPLTVPVLLAVLVLGSPAGLSAPAAEPVDLETAQSDLARLAASLKSRKSVREQIIGDLDAVERAYHHLKGPDQPELQEVPEDATEEQRKEIEDANQALQDAYEAENKKFVRERDKVRSEAEKLFIKALKLTKIHVPTKRNQRDDVNIRAAQILGATGNPKLAKDVQKALEVSIFKAKYEVPQLLLEECFAVLGKLGDEKTLRWLAKEFIHTNNKREEVDRLIAAHKAMVMFKYDDVDGGLRYEIVSEMVKIYSSTESQAKQNKPDAKIQAAKQFWDRVKNDAIKVVQHFSGGPTNEDGEALATMEEFQSWFRDHKNRRGDPWN